MEQKPQSPQLTLLSFEELELLINRSVSQISEKLNSENKRIDDDYLSRLETASWLKISLPTLLEHTKKGRIPSHRIGRRVLYKKHEVSESLKKIATQF